MLREVKRSLRWQVLDIGLGFGPFGPEGPEGPFRFLSSLRIESVLSSLRIESLLVLE